MSIYKIANLYININPIYEYTKKRMHPYLVNSEKFDFEIDITDNEISTYLHKTKTPCTPENAENILILTKICNIVLCKFNGFFFHSSSLMLDNEAYIFTAPSGTGKSTHTALWREYFGDKVTMINDDKPIIRKQNGRFFTFGTPWMGKSSIGNNISAPVKAVYVLERGDENRAEKVKPSDVFKQIFEATLIPTDKELMSTLLGLLDEFFSSVQLFRLTCNISVDAVKTAYEAANTN